jgi:putative membrane protein
MKKILGTIVVCAVAAALPFAAASARMGHATAARAYSAMDENWLQTSMQGDLFEIAGGRLAERRSHNRAVLRLARTLVSDHAKSYDDAVRLAHKLRISVEKGPTSSEHWELKVVASMRGAAFNRWYSSLEVADHVQDISETTDETRDGTSAKVIGDARTELPVLRRHLQLARAAVRATR